MIAISPNGTGPRSALKLDCEEVLRSAALASLAAVAATEARDRVAEDLRGGVLEDLHAGTADPEEAVRRAARMGCDLSAGAIVLAAEIRSGKPRFAAAVVTSEWEGAIAEPLESGRLLALLPGRGEDPAGHTIPVARTVTRRLRSHGPAAFSSYCADPSELGRAVREAELALDVIAHDDRLAEQLQDGIGGGVYRLLFRALASSPEEVESFYRDTVAALVEHDRRYRTDLLGTLEAYLANDCNTNATARAVFAHRHTVAHRLERVRELTGLDPSAGEDRERLGLGVKAYRILAPTLPR